MSVTTVGDVHIIDLGNGDNRLTDDVLDEFHRLSGSGAGRRPRDAFATLIEKLSPPA